MSVVSLVRVFSRLSPHEKQLFFCRMIPGGSTQKNGTGRIDNGMNWLMYELLWRDFFRYCQRSLNLFVIGSVVNGKQLAGHDGIILGGTSH